MQKKKSKNKFGWKPDVMIILIYLSGVIVWLGFFLFGGRDSYSGLVSKLVMAIFFIVILLIFVASMGLFVKGRKIKKTLLDIAEEIQNLSGDDRNNYIQILQEKEHVFDIEELDEAFNQFLTELEDVSRISSETKVNIADYINYDLVDSAISIHYLSQISGMMTGLGILGTFVGLSIGLNSFDLGGDSAELENKIAPLMGSIKIAFHTSICGLIYSLLYSLYFRRTLKDIRDAVDTFTDAFEDKLISSVDNGSTNTFIKYQERLCSVLEKQYEMQNAKLEQIYCHMEHQESTLDNLSIHISEELTEKMKGVIVPSIEQMTSTVKEFAESTRKNQLEGLEQIVDKFISQMDSSLGDSFAELGNVINETNDWQRKSLDEMKSVLDQIGKMAVDMAEINQEFADTVHSMNEYESNVAELQKSTVESMNSVHLQLQTGNAIVETQTVAMKDLAEKTVTTCGLMKQFVADVNDLVSKMDSANDAISEKSLKQIEEFTIKTNELCDQVSVNCKTSLGEINHVAEAQIKQLENINSEFTERVTSVTDAANTSISESSDMIKSKIGDMFEVNKEITGSIENSTNSLNRTVENMNRKLDTQLNETLGKFDVEIAGIMDKFALVLGDMRRSIKDVPLTVNGVYADMDNKFKEMQTLLDGYLMYADKLHRNMELKYKQLQDEMRDDQS